MRPGLSAEEFLATIWQERRRYVREGRIKQPHPWRVALSQGKVSREALIEYVKNRYYFLANINRKDAQVIANCPIPEARRTLLRKYIDEEGQDVAGGSLGPHYYMWLKISNALGVSRDVMESFGDVLPVYRYTVDAVFNFAKQQSWLEGVAATYATRDACGNDTRRKRSTEKKDCSAKARHWCGTMGCRAKRCFFTTSTAMPTTSTATSMKRY